MTDKENISSYKQHTKSNVPQEMNDSQSVIRGIMSGNLFLVFTVLFTSNLFYQLFAEFSFIKLLCNTLKILVCIGLWLIFFDARKNTLSISGFSMINIVITVELVFYICLDLLILIIEISLKLGATVDIIIIMLLCGQLFYWITLRMTTSRTKQIASGSTEPIYTSFYIIFILCLNVITKVCIFIWLNIEKSTVDAAIDFINTYGNSISSLVANILRESGLNYSYGYEASSSLINLFISPVTSWIQSTFGIGLDVPGMLLAIAVPVCEIIILSRMQSDKNNG
jgi:hypothetical protein